MNSKLLLERQIARNFMNNLLNLQTDEDQCTEDHVHDESCSTHPEHGSSHHEMEMMKGDIIPSDELYRHFDLNDDNVVTGQEYVDHIQYHCDNPETLEHYKKEDLNSQHTDVPCMDSYERCDMMLKKDPSSLDRACEFIINLTGSKCPESAMMAIVNCLKKC